MMFFLSKTNSNIDNLQLLYFFALFVKNLTNMKRIFLLIIAIFAIYGCCSSQSLLWKVTGKKIKSPSYLYGTIHIQDKKVFAYDNTVTDAMNSCDAFAMEILLDEVDPKESQEAVMLPNGKTLKDFMSADEYKMLDSAFKANTGQSLLMYSRLKPFFLNSIIMQSNMSQDMETALDLHLLKTARSAGKSCYGVEKFMDQIHAIDAISIDDQIKMLVDAVKDTTENSEANQFDDLLDAYLTFNLEKALEMSNDTSLPAEFNKIFLIDRNVGMAKNFAKIAKKQSLFCAVGAAHLPGEKGVIELLRKQGLIVEPVVFKWKEE